jgi:hypothetical protein
MKKAILFLLGAVLTTGVFAQTAKKEETKLTNTIVDKKEDKHVAGGHLKHLRVKKALRTRREVRRHRRTIRRTGNHLKNAHGVHHPVHKAKLRAKAEKDAKKGKE